MRIGYLGLGAMGGSLAGRLLGTHDLVVWDLSDGAVADMARRGAGAAGSAAELARECDIVAICLPRTSDVREALFGPQGLAEGLSAGKVVIDQTSGVPGETSAIARQLGDRGVLMLDAPVSGGVPAARAGTVTIIASGPDAAWEAARPVLEAMSSKVFRCSDLVGDGQALKLVNNAIGAGYRMATLELVAMGRRLGLSIRAMTEALNSGPGANFTTRNMLAAKLEGRASTDFALALMVKDLNEAIALGAEAGVPMPMTTAARGIMQIGLNLFGMDARLEDVIPLIERLSGVELADGPDATPPVAPADVPSPGELLAAIERAVELCNQLAVYECVAVGVKFGLGIESLASILNTGSAWSKSSEDILPDLAAGVDPDLNGTLGDAVADLRLVTRLAAKSNLPLLLPNAALAFLQAVGNDAGRDAGLGRMARGFEKAAGTTYRA